MLKYSQKQKNPQESSSVQKNEKAKYNLELARISHKRYLLQNSKEDLKEAIDYYINAIKLDPNVAQTYYRLACLLWEDDQISLDTAIEQCYYATKLEPKNADARIYAGFFLKLANKLDESEKEFKLAVKFTSPFSSGRPRLILAFELLSRLNNEDFSWKRFFSFLYFSCTGFLTIFGDLPSLKMFLTNSSSDLHIFYYKILGEISQKFNKNTLALILYKNGIKKTNGKIFFCHKLGDLLVKQESPKLALKAYSKILKLNPNDREALIKIATINQIYFSSNPEQAIRCYSRLLELEPENTRIYYELGHLYIKKKDSLNAVNAFKLALKSDESNPFYHNALAYAYYTLGLYDDAIIHYQQAINLNPDNEWTSFVCQALASVQFEIKDNVEVALSLYQTSLILNPDSEDSHIAIGDIYSSVNKVDLAVKSYCDAIKINPNNAKTYCKSAIVLWENDFIDEAIVAYNKAIEIDPSYDVAYNNLGVIYLDNIGNVKHALKLFEKAIKLNPKYTLAYFNSGRCAEKMKAKKEAQLFYQKALQLNNISSEIEEEEILQRLYKLFET